MLYSSITSHHFQQILVSQSAIICHEILSTTHFSQHRRQAKCTAVPLQIAELSHSHTTWLLVNTKSKIPLLNHQDRIETRVSTHTRKRQYKRLRIASVSSSTAWSRLWHAGHMRHKVINTLH